MPGSVDQYNVLLLVIYTCQLFVSVFSAYSLTKHLRRNFETGSVSAFMLSLCAFFLFFIPQVISVILSRIIDINDLQNTEMMSLKWIIWIISQMGVTLTLFLIGLFVYLKRFDLFLTVKSKQEVIKEVKDNE